jgi:hypothetical protein
MGRLTLNMLLSFAPFEREVIGERIRDKVAASKQRGMFMGGTPPLGYDVVDKKQVVNPAEADLVRDIFGRFVRTNGATTRIAQALNTEGKTTKAWTTKDGTVRPGAPWHKGHFYQMFGNRLSIGEIAHKGNVYPGEHEAILPRELWDQAQGTPTTPSRDERHFARGRPNVAVEEYRADMDRLGQFFEDCRRITVEAETQARVLYERYVAWCDHNHERALSSTAFGRDLTSRGFTAAHRRNGVSRQGIALRSE